MVAMLEYNAERKDIYRATYLSTYSRDVLRSTYS